ncbi:MAG: amidohydrolase family protein [Phycisphaerales bacterium]|nr:amidohydrolase family protein [Phycisphaerales bacterium]
MSASPTARSPFVNPSNRFGLDYEAEAARLGPPPVAISDVHTHIAGRKAARLFQRVMSLYGIERCWSMSPLEQVEPLQDVLGDAIQFIAVPDYWSKDRSHAHGKGFLDRIRAYHAKGARIVKFWSAPRGIDYAAESGAPGLLRLDSESRIEAMDLASSLGMLFMTHVADPDTWFATKYADAERYGSKRSHYEPLERMLERYAQPWIAAHLGGWPEDLEFLDGLLARHDNLHLDSSATKWMVRELSRHSAADLESFLRKWSGRVLFGSDIVTSDEHLVPAAEKNEMASKGNSPEEAFDLYASRYWALRTLFETDYLGESPIADPDLAMVDPARFGPMDAPELVGKRLPRDVLEMLYHGAAARLLGPSPQTPSR